MSEWTSKKAAILAVVLCGASVLFFVASIVGMSWQPGSGGQKDWGMLLGFAFSVLFICCGVAALISLVVSVSLVAHNRFISLPQVTPAAPNMASEPSQRKVRHPALIVFVGWALLIASAKLGPAALFFVGIPAVLVASAVAGGARSPRKIPLRDAVLFVGISVALVVGILMYAMYHH